MKSVMNNSKLLLVALVTGLLFLQGCAAVSSSLPSACPPLVQYDQDDLDRAADELEFLPENSMIETLLSDYSVLRAQVRACN